MPLLVGGGANAAFVNMIDGNQSAGSFGTEFSVRPVRKF